MKYLHYLILLLGLVSLVEGADPGAVNLDEEKKKEPKKVKLPYFKN